MIRKMASISTLLLTVVALSGVAAAADEAEKPKGKFARGEKLPGDLTDILDGDNSGQISDAEVNAAIEQFQKEANAREKTERGEKILGALDNNNNGKLDKAEAARGAAAARVQQGDPASKAVADIFKRIDSDSNGFITANEYARLKQIVALVNPDGVQKLDELFTALDVDRDTAVSFVESQLAADLFAENGGLPNRGGFGQNAPPAEPAANAKVQAFVEATFAQRDRNEDGVISAIESRRDPALRREFGAADASGNGELTPGELYDYLVKKFSAGQ